MERVLREQPQKCDRWLRGFAEQVKNKIVLSFGTSPPGLVYQRGGVTHVASRPGYPPNVDIGTLRASMKTAPDGYLTYRIEDGTDYGINLEDGIGMAPRPFMRPQFDEAARVIESDARQNLRVE